MKRKNLVGVALPVILILCAIASSAAQAAEAPYFGIESKRLGAGETVEITATQRAEYTLSTGGILISCEKSGVKAGAAIVGSAAGEPGTIKETILYEKCKITADGTGCAIGHEGSGVIQTEPLKNELVYDATSKESKSVGVDFTPETGAVLSKITLTGAGCTPIAAGVLAVEGQVVAQAFGGTEAKTEFLLELGKAPILATTSSIRFPVTKIASVILFKAGVGTQTAISFKFAGKAIGLLGETAITLSGGKKYEIKS